ncbi:MAG: DUF2173 family protein [Candidatus Competibacterales bacterium]
MIRRLLLHEGVIATCLLRDDGALVEGYGLIDREALQALGHFAHHYRRLLQANVDQFALFTGRRGFAPPQGFYLKGEHLSVVGVSAIVCLVETQHTAIDPLLVDVREIAHW